MKSLEALKEIEKCMVQNCDYAEYYNEFKVIEKELKAYEELESMHEELAKAYNKLCQEKIEWLKQKQALEIIRTKHVDMHWLISSKNRSTYNLGVGGIHELKKKEYDLLKEVML